jgi:hypothetical protein
MIKDEKELSNKIIKVSFCLLLSLLFLSSCGNLCNSKCYYAVKGGKIIKFTIPPVAEKYENFSIDAKVISVVNKNSLIVEFFGHNSPNLPPMRTPVLIE